MDFFEMSLAFVEGVALIASPCILPVLPLILSTSIEEGRAKPYGVIIGLFLLLALGAASCSIGSYLGFLCHKKCLAKRASGV